MGFPMIIETERLCLEPFADRHLAGLHALSSDPEVMRFIGPVQTLEETRSAISKASERWQRLGYGWWAIRESASKRIIGAACLQNIANDEDAPLEIGWRLAPLARRKGYATEAGRAAINFAFDGVRTSLVLAVANQENKASHRVMQRLGMTYRGIETHYGLPLTTYAKYCQDGDGGTAL
jgi:RimJ/RimL family protein N-acetyltransferase